MTNLKLFRDNNDGKLPAYAWPGGYTIIYWDKHGSTFCADCANQDDCSEPIVDGDIYYEGPVILCDGCNCEIESAYGNPEE